MKVLIIGNHTCANRGDAAILRGLVNSLEKVYPDMQVEILSRYVMAGKFILGRDMVPDFTYVENRKNKNIIARIKKRISFELLLLSLKFPGLKSLAFSVMSAGQKAFKEYINKFDVIIQVGGSFFVDLYGIRQFENTLIALHSDKRVLLLGHSLGPFQTSIFKRYSKAIFPKIESIKLRDLESQILTRKENLLTLNFSMGADTAWLLEDLESIRLKANEFNDLLSVTDKLIAITVRDLAPFDKRLGVTQNQYEDSFCRLIESFIDRGYHIVGVSMCTGLDRYDRDDRMVALRIKNKLKNPDGMTVLMNEYSDLETGKILSGCKMLIGTRLHSVIIALRYNIPTIAILYEHKSKGVLEKLQLKEFSFFIQEMEGPAIMELTSDILNNPEKYKALIKPKIDQEREEALNMISVF